MVLSVATVCYHLFSCYSFSMICYSVYLEHSLTKMIASFINHSKTLPTKSELKHAILRNFDGLDGVSPTRVFLGELQNVPLPKVLELYFLYVYLFS